MPFGLSDHNSVAMFSKNNNKYCAGKDIIVYCRIVDNSSKALLAQALNDFNWSMLYCTSSCEDMA